MKIKNLVGIVIACVASVAIAGKQGSGEGTVDKVNKKTEKITITHGQLGSLMGPMTMDFSVLDPSMLSDVSAGDKIKFTVEESSGNYVVTDVQVLGKAK